jgi:(p)ppGpp synthase/HD superfamily hydrolase
MTKKAIKLMYEKHKDQVDKAGMPYVLHPLHVAEQMSEENRTTVALLHDIVEDTDVTLEQLAAMGFPQEVLEALNCLTHPEGMEYFEYVQNIGTNEIATDVKLADLAHNSDLSRLNDITEWDLVRAEKYKTCIAYLNNVKYLREQEGKNLHN